MEQVLYSRNDKAFFEKNRSTSTNTQRFWIGIIKQTTDFAGEIRYF